MPRGHRSAGGRPHCQSSLGAAHRRLYVLTSWSNSLIWLKEVDRYDDPGTAGETASRPAPTVAVSLPATRSTSPSSTTSRAPPVPDLPFVITTERRTFPRVGLVARQGSLLGSF